MEISHSNGMTMCLFHLINTIYWVINVILGDHVELWSSVLRDVYDTQQIDHEFDVNLQCPHCTNLLKNT